MPANLEHRFVPFGQEGPPEHRAQLAHDFLRGPLVRFAGAEKGYFYNGTAYAAWDYDHAYVQYVKAHECNAQQNSGDTADIYLVMPGVRWRADHTYVSQTDGVHMGIREFNADPTLASACLVWAPFDTDEIVETFDAEERVIAGVVIGGVALGAPMPIISGIQNWHSDFVPAIIWPWNCDLGGDILAPDAAGAFGYTTGWVPCDGTTYEPKRCRPAVTVADLRQRVPMGWAGASARWPGDPMFWSRDATPGNHAGVDGVTDVVGVENRDCLPPYYVTGFIQWIGIALD